jgi:hypothetical protein
MTLEPEQSSFGSPEALAREIFPEIEGTILQLVVDGFERWRVGGFQRYGDYEDHFTVRLVKCMNDVRRERNLALVARFQDVEPSDAMLEGEEDPARAPRIDVTVSWDFLVDDAYFSIECKRLALGDLARRYVVEGIVRFTRAFYGTKARTGAMVGYVISDSPGPIVADVNVRVAQLPELGPAHTLSPSASIGSLTTVFTSSHSRKAPFPAIRLTHLLFDATALPPA